MIVYSLNESCLTKNGEEQSIQNSDPLQACDYLDNRSMRESTNERSSSGRLFDLAVICDTSLGFSFSSSKKSLGVTPRYSQIAKNSVIEGNARPLDIPCI